jgi:hypothetical protein
MPRFFDKDGDEFKYAADRNAEIIGEIGGKPEKTSVTISVYSGRLDKDRVTKLLEVNPTKAWNPNERRASGYHGRTRIDDWGKWFLSTETNDKPLNEKIEKLFSICTRNLSDWHLLSEEYETWLTIVGHINNWNREVHLSRTTLKLIAERNLALTYYIYFDEEDDSE